MQQTKFCKLDKCYSKNNEMYLAQKYVPKPKPYHSINNEAKYWLKIK